MPSLLGRDATSGPYPTRENSDGSIYAFSSFGVEYTQLSPSFPAHALYNSERARELSYRENYFTCRQHDYKTFDWEGRQCPPQRHMTQPFINTSMPETYIPLHSRRPGAPYRLGRKIVSSFTELVFGHGRWPNVISEDPDTQNFCQQLVKTLKLKTRMLRARNLGGACGTVGISWRVENGTPKVSVHQGRYIHALEWEDEDEMIPSHVVELYQYPRDVYNREKRKMERVIFWHRRDWTKVADVRFKPVKVTKENPNWEIDEEKTHTHPDGKCHFIWIQNTPDEETLSVDGQADYAEVYEQLDSLDILNSVSVSGTVKNLDPTLKLKMDREDVGPGAIRKGSDHSLVTGLQGDASYLEISGASVTAGIEAVRTQRSQILEVCQCVIPDPDQVAAGSVSSVAIKLVYAPSIGRADVLREKYGEALIRLLDQILTLSRMLLPQKNAQGESDYVYIVDPETGEESPVEFELDLPPIVNKEEIIDEEGNPTGEFTVNLIQQHPGAGSISLDWPEYFPMTAADRQQEASAHQITTGGKPVVSQQTAVEEWAKETGRDAAVEWARIRDEQAVDRELTEGMFPGVGGEVDVMEDLPDGAEELDGESSEQGQPDQAAGAEP